MSEKLSSEVLCGAELNHRSYPTSPAILSITDTVRLSNRQKGILEQTAHADGWQDMCVDVAAVLQWMCHLHKAGPVPCTGNMMAVLPLWSDINRQWMSVL